MLQHGTASVSETGQPSAKSAQTTRLRPQSRDMVIAGVMIGAADKEAKAEIEKSAPPRRVAAIAGVAGTAPLPRNVVESTGVFWEPVYSLLGADGKEQRRLKRWGNGGR